MDTARRDDAHADLVANLAWVRRLALTIVRDDALADDVAQDVAWTALRHPPTARPGSLEALRAWLAKAARRLAIDRARAETARRAREHAVARPEVDGGSAEAVDRGARSQRVVDAVMQLSEPYRSAILLRYMDQLPMQVVAERLGASEVTVRKRITTGLAMLRSRLDDEFGQDSRSWAVALLGLKGPEAAAVPTPAAGLLAILHGALVMNAKWVAAGIAVVLVGLAAWFATPQLDRERGALENASSARTELSGLTVPPSEDAQRTNADRADQAAQNADPSAVVGPFVIVRSSIRLPLPFADVQDAQADWQRADLDQDRCSLDPAIPLPRLVRAPGHVPALATRFGEELVLEPDALLTLEAEGLRTRTRSIRVENRFGIGEAPMAPEMRQAVAFGFLSDDTWCVAVSHDLVRAAVFGDDLDVEVLWPDHQRADVHLRALPGMRGHWTVPVERGAAGSPLRLHVQRPAEHDTGEVVFRLSVAHVGFRDPILEQFAWGSAVVYDPQSLWLDEQKLAAGSSDYTFEFLPAGVPLLLGAYDKSTCAYGRLSFVHDGTDRTLELKPAFVLRGCLLAADDKSPVTTANFVWEFRDEPETMYFWRCEKFPFATDPAGCFEACGPMQMALTDRMVLDPPSRLVIQVKAPGFESFERAVDTAGATSFECGQLLLTRRTAQLTLAPGHGVSPQSLDWNRLQTSSMPDVFWDMRGGAVNADGSMSVFLADAEESPKDKRLFAASRPSTREDFGLPWPSDPGRWLTVHLDLGEQDETWLFERQEGGSYVAVPRREVELDLKCGEAPPDGDAWTLGWQLYDMKGVLGIATPNVVGEVSHVRFSVPVGAQLGWSARHTPRSVRDAPANVGGTVSIDALQGRLVLR